MTPAREYRWYASEQPRDRLHAFCEGRDVSVCGLVVKPGGHDSPWTPARAADRLRCQRCSVVAAEKELSEVVL